MRRLEVPELGEIVRVLQDEVSLTPRSRFLHRLHCVRLVAAGMSCYAVAAVFGDHPRTIERWVRLWQRAGTQGLCEGRPGGRRPALAPEQMAHLASAVARTQSNPGAVRWNGAAVRDEIDRRFGVALSKRQCQRLLRALRPGPRAGADPAVIPSGAPVGLSTVFPTSVECKEDRHPSCSGALEGRVVHPK